LLRRSDKANTLFEVSALLKQVEQIGEKLTDDQKAETLLILAIHSALSGQTESARKILTEFTDGNAHHGKAKELLKALDD
jgi:hypothetical protein